MEPCYFKLDIVSAALLYLDNTGSLKDIKEKCNAYQPDLRQKNNGTYSFSIPLEPMDIMDLDVQLGDVVLHNPKIAHYIFQEVVSTIITSLNLMPGIESNQIVVILRLLSVPGMPCYRLNSFKHFPHPTEGKRYFQFSGIVTGATVVHKYTKSARYRCPETSCLGNSGSMYIRLHAPGAKEAQTIRRTFHCQYCNGTLEEDVKCRELGDKIVVDMVDSGTFHHSIQSVLTTGVRSQAVKVFVRDELVNDVEIGQHYRIIGLPTYETLNGTITVSLEMNNIVSTRISQRQTGLPERMRLLHEDRRTSPWSFGLSLAYMFGGEISPPGTYLHLKLGLLLSLIGRCDNPSYRMDTLVIGKDTGVLHQLLMYAASFSERTIVHSSGHHLMGKALKDKHSSGSYFVEGGSLLLANGGVCYLGDVGRFKKKTMEELQQALEGGNAQVTIPPKFNGGLPEVLTYPLRCKVWAYMEPTKKTNAQMDVPGWSEMDNATRLMADKIGMVYSTETDSAVEEYANSLISHQMLMNAVAGQDRAEPAKKYGIDFEEFKKFIDIASQQVVEFTEAAKDLICRYYISSRNMYATSVQGSTFPRNAVQVITSLAASHARLHHRPDVLEGDAVMAILLYEESVVARLGMSALSVQPTPHIRDNDLDEYIGLKNDKKMQQFHIRILRFCTTHAGDEE
ncbi:minichromosome maintenance domain-containing protein 2-like [Lineus longissimus]|uniref:minichromosome maintenance domain-containing protein 2-like n=1 Tax=Lineus longissimus TaxID=88925 RepID=UPI00315DE38E